MFIKELNFLSGLQSLGILETSHIASIPEPTSHSPDDVAATSMELQTGHTSGELQCPKADESAQGTLLEHTPEASAKDCLQNEPAIYRNSETDQNQGLAEAEEGQWPAGPQALPDEEARERLSPIESQRVPETDKAEHISKSSEPQIEASSQSKLAPERTTVETGQAATAKGWRSFPQNPLDILVGSLIETRVPKRNLL